MNYTTESFVSNFSKTSKVLTSNRKELAVLNLATVSKEGEGTPNVGIH